jgi:hypothetical protein
LPLDDAAEIDYTIELGVKASCQMPSIAMPSTAASSPMTPNRSAGGGKKFNIFASIASNPSTTPAGPPPSSAGSFTPAGEPPVSLFGSASSRYGSGKLFSSRLGDEGRTNGSPISRREAPLFRDFGSNFSRYDKSGSSPSSKKNKSSGTFTVPFDDSLISQTSDADGDDEIDNESYNGGDMDHDDLREAPSMSFQSSFLEKQTLPAGSSTHSTPRSSSGIGTKRQRDSLLASPSKRLAKSRSDLSQYRESPFPVIARDIASKHKLSKVDEPGSVILNTEDALNTLQQGKLSQGGSITEIAGKLQQSWTAQVDSKRENDYEIVPRENVSKFTKASFLSTLLLQLHHPQAKPSSKQLALSRSLRQSTLLTSPQPSHASNSAKPMSIPQVLLTWLNEQHNAAQAAIVQLQSYHPDPSNHPEFWYLIFTSLLHGKVKEVVAILQSCNFKHLRGDDRDSRRESYSGTQLSNIKIVMERAIQILSQCPAVVSDNWDVDDGDWTIWRLRVSQTIEDLTSFVEGMDQIGDENAGNSGSFTAENFGIRSTRSGATAVSRAKLEVRVPFFVFENLKTLYGILLGSEDEIVSFAADWIEATVGLTVWWDGNSVDAFSRSTGRTSGMFQTSIFNGGQDATNAGYIRRLATAFRRVTDEGTQEEAFQIDSSNSAEVGLACIFEGNLEGAIGIIQTLSLTLADAIVEIACIGGWLDDSTKSLTNQLSGEDLMVLSYGQAPVDKGIDRDDVLATYANALFRRGELEDKASSSRREGWEIGVQVLSRLHNTARANQDLYQLLSTMPLTSRGRVDKLLALCKDLDLAEQARKISSRYADLVAEKTNLYGEALVYYALAHDSLKVKAVLNLLITHCLVNSISYPPESEMDERLKDLIQNPVSALEKLVILDVHASELLQTYLSGYATLRKFYDLRDQTGLAGVAKQNSLARKREAAAALVAVIASSEDNIHGGLYDEERGAVVAVDGLLALLGEALVLVDQPECLFTVPQVFTLLKAIEDISTVHSNLRRICEEFLEGVLQATPSPQSTQTSNNTSFTSVSLSASQGPMTRSTRSRTTNVNGHGSNPAPHHLTQPPRLEKDTSAMTTSSSGFSLIGSSLMHSSTNTLSSFAFTGSSSGLTEGAHHSHVNGLSGPSSTQSSGFLVMPTLSVPATNGTSEPNSTTSKVPSTQGPVTRGWDWRLPTREMGKFDGEALLSILRLALGKELARGWLERN